MGEAPPKRYKRVKGVVNDDKVTLMVQVEGKIEGGRHFRTRRREVERGMDAMAIEG